MHVWTMARARAIIGGPSFESRTPCRAASFQSRTALSPAANTSRGNPPRAGAAAARAAHLSVVRRVIRSGSRSLMIALLPGSDRSRRLVDGYLALQKDLVEGQA